MAFLIRDVFLSSASDNLLKQQSSSVASSRVYHSRVRSTVHSLTMVASSKKESSVMAPLLVAGVIVSVLVVGVESFSTSPSITRNHNYFAPSSTIQGRCASERLGSALFAAGGKKKRRRRKRKTEGEAETSSPEPPASVEASVSSPEVPVALDAPVDSGYEEFNPADIKSVADFSFDGPVEAPPQTVDEKAAAALPNIVQEEDGSIPLPDIRDTLKRKKMGETAVKGVMEDNMPKTKIDRTDRDALLKVRSFYFASQLAK